MAGIFHSNNLDADFKSFQKTLLKSNKYLYSIDETNKPALKKYHRLTYTVALFDDKLEEKWNENNKYLFVNEILSDLLANISITYIGFYYSSQILSRRLIENFYHHIYYFEHPVEFELLNLGRNDYTPIDDLRKYLEAHPVIQNYEDDNIKLLNTQIFGHFQELCRTVHTKGEDFMGLAKNLEEIKPEINIVNHINSLNRTLSSIIYLLYKFHTELNFSNVEKDIISKCIPKNMRGSLFA